MREVREATLGDGVAFAHGLGRALLTQRWPATAVGRMRRVLDACERGLEGIRVLFELERATRKKATRIEMKMDCQNEKKRMPFTQRNFGMGLDLTSAPSA